MLLRVSNPFPSIAKVAQWAYDAVKGSLKRPSPTGVNRSGDADLLPAQRAQMVSAGRDIHQNFALVGWAVRKHLDYVSTFTFQGKLENAEHNARVEAFVKKWSAKENFDVAQRHDLRRFIRLAEQRRLLDGDVFIAKLDGEKRIKGKVQALEGDRIRSRYGEHGGLATPAGQTPPEVIQGVEIDEWGAATSYHVWRRRRGGTGFEFEKPMKAKWVFHHFYIDRFDQTRGVSPFAPVYNTLTDLYKGFDYALAKMKLSQLLGFIVTRTSAEELGEHEEIPTIDPATGQRKIKYKVKLGDDPIKMELDPGEDVKIVESAQPSREFQSFSQTLIALVLKALDIPYSFYAENFSNYSGSRQALLQYEQSADNRRAENRDLLNDLTLWRLKMAIEDSDPDLAGITLDELRWEWVASALPWIDPVKEVTANIAAVANGFDSTPGVCKAQGRDAFEIAKEQADYEKKIGDYRESIGLPRVPASNAVSYAQLAALSMAPDPAPSQEGAKHATAA